MLKSFAQIVPYLQWYIDMEGIMSGFKEGLQKPKEIVEGGYM